MMSAMSRAISARERWQQIVVRQRNSGLSVAEFCRRHNVPASSFFAWKRQLGAQASASAGPAFVAVETVGRRGAWMTSRVWAWASSCIWGGRHLVVRRGLMPRCCGSAGGVGGPAMMALDSLAGCRGWASLTAKAACASGWRRRRRTCVGALTAWPIWPERDRARPLVGHLFLFRSAAATAQGVALGK